jgi:hypothetical protein
MITLFASASISPPNIQQGAFSIRLSDFSDFGLHPLSIVASHRRHIQSDTSIDRCHFSVCESYKGGAAFIDSDSVTVTSSVFTDNRASVAGSILVQAPLVCTISRTLCSRGLAHVVCGGFLIDGAAQQEIGDSNVSDTTAPSAALLDIWDGQPRVAFCRFANGRATRCCGNVRTSSYQPRWATVKNCVFVNCSCAGEGGAFFAFWFYSWAIIASCWFEANSSGRGNGRSIFLGNTRVKCELRCCAFSGNLTIEIASARPDWKADVDKETKFEQTEFEFAVGKRSLSAQ